MEMALFEELAGNIESAREIFKRGSDLPVSKSHPPLIEGWSSMESACGNHEEASKLKRLYEEATRAREAFMVEQKAASLNLLKVVTLDLEDHKLETVER